MGNLVAVPRVAMGIGLAGAGLVLASQLSARTSPITLGGL